MSWFWQRWRTQWNAIVNVKRRSKWIIRILNANCAMLLGLPFNLHLKESRISFIYENFLITVVVIEFFSNSMRCFYIFLKICIPLKKVILIFEFHSYFNTKIEKRWKEEKYSKKKEEKLISNIIQWFFF